MKIEKILALGLAGITTLSLVGCGNAQTDASASAGDVKKITIGIGNGWKPFCYLDENGEEDGYEYQVLKAVDEYLTDYEFEFEPLDWTNVLVSLDSKKVDLASHTFTLNEERAEKYAYTTETYYDYAVYLYVAADNDSVNSLEDLAGQPVYAVTGEASTQAVEAWNEANPDKAVDLNYANYSTEQVVAAIDSGKLAAWFGTVNVLNDLNESYGNKLKAVGDPILDENSIFLLNKGDEAVASDIDAAIKALREDGTLSKLSVQYLGEDFTGVTQ